MNCTPFCANRSRSIFIYLHSHWNRAQLSVRSLISFRKSFILLSAFFLGIIPAVAQNASSAERSPETIALIQRVLAASGGNASIGAIHDVVATGTISPPMASKETAESAATALTISMRGLDQLRVDSVLPAGKRSLFFNRGALSSKEKDGAIIPRGSEDAVSSTSHFFPWAHLAAALQDTSYSVTDPEPLTDAETGANLYHFRLRRIRTNTAGPAHPTTSSVAIDYYIDATTSYIVRVKHIHSDRGFMPPDNGRGPYDIYDFSDYSLEQGLLLPHQVVVSSDKRLISTINITSYQLNAGLPDNIFIPTSPQ
jgi:hypothetical protein